MIKILKASAGSGKTWNLARQYLKLLLEKHDPYAYRHILAVTFTNKATDEMKDRILKELHVLAKDPCSSGYYGDFVPALYPDAASLSEAADILLCNMLHDYTAFAVSTIDRFFQQTLKTFAREIGQFSSYAIELDKASLVRESVDRLLDSLTETQEHSRALEWMTRKTLTQLEEGDGFKLDLTLRKIADRFNSEEFRIASAKAGTDKSMLYSDARLEALDKGCDRVISDYVELVASGAARVYSEFDAAGLDPADTTRHFMSSNLKKYEFLQKGDAVPPLTDAFRRNASDVTLWFPKAKKYMEGMVTAGIECAVADFLSLFDKEYKVYNTALQLRKQIYGFAVADALYDNFNSLLKEKNVMTIDQTNAILRGIIDGCDTPFIYEKSGVRYDHFLLDEFQDTSLVQWDNFRPLLDNSVAGGNENLIVGDVKQSIYRWRQSEWELLEHQVSDDFPGRTHNRALDTNFRSCADIVEFNNAYFKAASEYLDSIYGEGDVVRRIYSDVEQKVHKESNGMVEVRFCEEESFYADILASVRKAVDKGYRLGDITVLVRLNKEGGLIAEYLIENGIPVVSDDSLKVASSLTVRRLVALLAGIADPQDSMAGYLAESLGVEAPQSWRSLTDLCEDILRRLSESDPETFRAETLYIQSFMDLLMDFTASEGNSLRGFLKRWAEDKSAISSPKSDDSVRIMTVHKSKGLDFPYVIFPSLGSVGFYEFTSRWSRPDVQGTALEDIADGVYDVYLSGKSEDTLFADRYREEKLMQYIDNINVLYVALTRASHAMTIITPMPSEGEIKGFAQWTKAYMEIEGENLGFIKESEDMAVSYIKGSMPVPPADKEISADGMPVTFSSWPQKGRLRLSADAVDFFSEDGLAGASASNRIRGVILHDILSRVVLPEDLSDSVRQAVLSGDLTEDEASDAEALLSQRIGEVMDRGWFPSDRESVMNEKDLLDVDGSISRPDRVVVDGRKVVIIDYKFGEHDGRYLRQLSRYRDIWKRLGYEDVSAMLWYVQTGEIVEV